MTEIDAAPVTVTYTLTEGTAIVPNTIPHADRWVCHEHFACDILSFVNGTALTLKYHKTCRKVGTRIKNC